ncbi:lactonase family protein [Nonomuraea sp. NPDC050663]|uniref:lactonase family protein n=1 Tax=Nonomuraea sp. NPDC050663 TaxID=3364370 RepID=UPI0037B3EF86
MPAVKHLYLGGYGPAVVRIDEALQPQARVPFPRASFLALHPTLPVLYAIGENDEGVVAAFDRDGLTPIGERSSGGSAACHLAVHPSGGVLAVANYGDGTASLHLLDERGHFTGEPILLPHTGNGPVSDRQQNPHAHQAVFDDDVLHVSDLGTDEIRRYSLSGEPLGFVRLAPGLGPRHFAFDGTHWHVAGELDNSVTSYDASWRPVARADASATPGSFPSHLEARDGLVYVANRGPDTISVLRAGSLEKVAEVSCGGAWPRHFALADDRLLVANQNSGEVVGFILKDGVPQPDGLVIAMESPACVLPA